MTRILYDSLLLVLLASLATSEEVSDSQTLEGSAGKKSPGQDTTKMIYSAIFKQKRSQQKIAAENILNFGEYSKRYRMVDLILGKIFKTIQDAKTVVMESGYIPGDSFPSEETHLEALSNILENTALFGDILLRLPDITHKVYSKSKEWELLARWCVSFCNETQVFDGSDSKLLNLMAQELKLIPRDPNYMNPYRKDSKEGLRREQSVTKEPLQKKKKEKKKRGPRLSNVEL